MALQVVQHIRQSEDCQYWTQTVRIGGHASSTLVLNIRAPQGCVLSHLLVMLNIYNCIPRHEQNSVVKLADDTTFTSRIGNTDKTSHQEEINKSGAQSGAQRTNYCSAN